MQIGVISDTHSLVRPEAIVALIGCEFILHAGDIGKPEVIQALSEIAPVIAIRGNIDQGSWAAAIPEQKTVTLEHISVHLIHNLKELAIDPRQENIQVVISGHSHQPSVIERDGVLFVNPGSAGPRRFKLPICVAQLQIAADRVQAKIIELAV